MKITYLQKLDFLLKIINAIDKSNKYKLAFGFKGTTYVGDFIPSTDYITPKTWNFKIKELDLKKLKDNSIKASQKIPYTIIEGENDDWKSIWQNGKGDLFRSDLGKLNEASNQLVDVDYLKLLNTMLDNHDVIFNDSLLPYIYNVKNLINESPINFMKVDEDAEFDFVSLILEDTI
ncbi:hypothetical protein [Staphylococcus xylosus]|uniref:hypothetical protein n=1 Tax=Staphylococcus xylosus TaxID=1288 RepID=UPI001F17BD90|nr:hypothetical protein [Staphylococcus xylosus]MCE4994729.1 hypothetical protein [Staphylococcus xylosus]MCE7784119.1 hypothetical protein [Staphylococcus xylosus]